MRKLSHASTSAPTAEITANGKWDTECHTMASTQDNQGFSSQCKIIPACHTDSHYFLWEPPSAARYAPESIKSHLTSSQVPTTTQSQGAGITLASNSFRGGVQDDQGFASDGGISDVIGSVALLSKEFKLWLNRHPGLSIDEARHRYRKEQKAKRRRIQVPKL